MGAVAEFGRAKKPATLTPARAALAFWHIFIFPVRNALAAELCERRVQDAQLMIVY